MTRIRSFARRSSILAAALVAAATTIVGPASAATTETLPSGFTDTLVASIPEPIAIAFTPDGRTLVTEQTGQLRVIAGGKLLAKPAIDLSAEVCSDIEDGLMGVAVDPNFTTNHFVYLYYTRMRTAGCPYQTSGAPANRVSRFVLRDNSVISPSSEKILVDNMPATGGYHNGGDLEFGPDGDLYITVGDGGCDYAGDSGCGGQNDASRDQFILLGKVLRITPTGGIPADNPFHTATDNRCSTTGHTVPGHRCRETYAWGLRNPFHISFDPNTTSAAFRIDDVGQDTWEEIDASKPGADYGWNVREGHCAEGSTTDCGKPPKGMTNPIFDYAHATGCEAITGAAYVPDGAWAAKWDGHYLYADYVCNEVFDLVPRSGGGYRAKLFATGLQGGGPVNVRFGTSGSKTGLYYTTYAGGGQLRVIKP